MGVDIESATARIFESSRAHLRFACDMICMKHADKCESNIELLFLAACEVMNLWNSVIGKPAFVVLEKNDSKFDPAVADIGITPQFDWNGYRIDFCVHFRGGKIFIECDGHDFHERTKEQAARDRKKDRLIQQAGIPILRFTGSETYRNPVDCVYQVLQFITNRTRGF